MRVPRHGFAVLAAPILALLAAWVPWPPALVERGYSSGVYPTLQPVVTSLSNRSAFAWLDVIVAVLVVATMSWLIVSWRRRPSLVRWLAHVASVSACAVAVIYLVFLAAWGLNYRRLPARERFDVDAARLTGTRLRALADRTIEEVNRLAPARDEWRLALPTVAADLAPAFADATRSLGTTWQVEPGRPKRSLLARLFPWSAVDGMVNPFGLEVILNPEVLPFERPFVLAHEWAHLAGHADESEASFVAFVTCLGGPRQAQYSGWLSLLIHAWRSLPPGDRRALSARIGPRPRGDLQAISARLARVQPLVHAVSWRVYDEYLKAQGVDAGIASYDAVVQLVLGAAQTASLAEPLPPSADPGDVPDRPR